MFDTKAEIGLKVMSPEGAKKITVRFPTDAELTEWRRKKKVLQTDLGRRKFQIEPSRPDQCDLDLLKRIRLDEDGPAIDKDESSYVIGQLTDCEVSVKPERNGAAYTITMKAMRKLESVHVLRIPSVKEMMDFERSRSSVVFGAYGHQEIRINFTAAGELYDKLKRSADGYAGEVPINHKAEVVNVLLQEIRADEEGGSEADDDSEGE